MKLYCMCTYLVAHEQEEPGNVVLGSCVIIVVKYKEPRISFQLI